MNNKEDSVTAAAVCFAGMLVIIVLAYIAGAVRSVL